MYKDDGIYLERKSKRLPPWRHEHAHGNISISSAGIVFSKVYGDITPAVFSFLRDATFERMHGIEIAGYVGLFSDSNWSQIKPKHLYSLLKGSRKSAVADVPNVYLVRPGDYFLFATHCQSARDKGYHRETMVDMHFAFEDAMTFIKRFASLPSEITMSAWDDVTLEIIEETKPRELSDSKGTLQL